jgi:hypothetical protein
MAFNENEQRQRKQPLFYYINVDNKVELKQIMKIVYEVLDEGLNMQYVRSLHFDFTLRYGYVYGAEIALEHDAREMMGKIVERIHREVEPNRISWEWDGVGKPMEPRR